MGREWQRTSGKSFHKKQILQLRIQTGPKNIYIYIYIPSMNVSIGKKIPDQMSVYSILYITCYIQQ